MAEEENHIFYNVMPAEKADGPMVNAPVGTSTVSVGSATTSSRSRGAVLASMAKNSRIPIIIGAAVVILAAAFGGYKLLKSRTNNPTPATQATQNNPDQQPSAPQQPTGVTTSPEWQKRYFANEICQTVEVCGDESDPDRDGLKNIDEQKLNTDPNNPDSSGGGIADGDKVNIFGGDPLKAKSKAGKYTDADYYKYGYDLATDQPYAPDKLQAIKDKITKQGFHQPTIKTLGPDGLKLYDFTDPTAPTDPLANLNIDMSASAKLDRDTQRSATIKKVGTGLLAYRKDHTTFPTTTDFAPMTEQIKPYILVATNFNDPINKDKYVYGYIPSNVNQDFTLTYYSETQNLLIKYKASDAKANDVKQNSSAMDNQRRMDLENIRVALLLYSSHNTDSQSTQQYVFPPAEKYTTALVPDLLKTLPKDPVTKNNYIYNTSDKFDTFTLKTALDNPAPGTTGYVCNQESCQNY